MSELVNPDSLGGIYKQVAPGGQDDLFVDPFDAPSAYDGPQVTQQQFDAIMRGDFASVSDADVDSMYSGNKTTRGQIYEQVQTAPVQVNNPRQADRASDVGGNIGKLVRLGQSFVGTPYVWGGTSPDGFDCSGLMQYLYAKIGVNLPRVSYEQARAGKRVGLDGLRAGDLVAWDNSTRNNGADHIAMYIGGGQILEAPRPGASVRVRKLGNNEGAWGVRVLGGE